MAGLAGRVPRVVLGGREVLVLALDLPAFARTSTLPTRGVSPAEAFRGLAAGGAFVSETLAYPLGLRRGGGGHAAQRHHPRPDQGRGPSPRPPPVTQATTSRWCSMRARPPCAPLPPPCSPPAGSEPSSNAPPGLVPVAPGPAVSYARSTPMPKCAHAAPADPSP